MYWLFEVRGRQLTRIASSPDLAGLLRGAGHDDPVLARQHSSRCIATSGFA